MVRFIKRISIFFLAILLFLPSCGRSSFVPDIPDPLASLTSEELQNSSWESSYTSEEAETLFGEVDPFPWGYTFGYSAPGGAAQFWNDYILYGRNMGTENHSNIVLCKYDIHTGESSPLCPDPLCLHDSDACPLYDIARFIVRDDLILYTTNKAVSVDDANYNTYGLYCYDIKANATTLISDELPLCYTSDCFFGKYGNGIYFSKLSIRERELLEPVSTLMLMRYDTESKKAEEVAEIYSYENSGGFEWQMLTEDGRLFWVMDRADETGAKAEVWCLSLAEGGEPTLFLEMPFQGQINGSTGCSLQYSPSRKLFYFEISSLFQATSDAASDGPLETLTQLYEVSEEGETKLVKEGDTFNLYTVSAGKYLYKEFRTNGDFRLYIVQENLETGEEKTVFTMPKIEGYYGTIGGSLLLHKGMLYILRANLGRDDPPDTLVWPIVQVDLATGRMRTSEGDYFD